MKPMQAVEVGDRVRGLRSDFGRTGVVTKVEKVRGMRLPVVTVRYNHSGLERRAPLSRWEKL